MTDTEDDDGLQYGFPGCPVIPLCVRDEFAFEGLDTRNERDRKKIKDAWSHALEKTSHPLLSGYFIGHFVRWNPAAELYALEYVFKTKPEWRNPAKWPELRNIANADSEWMGGTAWTTERWTECCREVLRILPMDEADRDDAMEVWGEAGDKGGRPASRKTTDAQRVMDALNVTADRAYKILRRGTGKLESRVALAGASPMTRHATPRRHGSLRTGRHGAAHGARSANSALRVSTHGKTIPSPYGRAWPS